MREPPRARRQPLLDRRLLSRAFGFLGLVQAFVALGLVPLAAAWFLGWRPGAPLPQAGLSLSLLSTMVFAAIVLMQMVNAFECRSTRASVLSRGVLTNRLLSFAVLAELSILLLLVYEPWLSGLLRHRPLGPGHWLLILLAPLTLLVAEELRKLLLRRPRRGSPAPLGDVAVAESVPPKGV
jgi:sodium/potassium-transporting ATPase subunit alpha